MKLVKDNISIEELKKIAQAGFGILVKAVVDIKKEVMVVDAELHADEEAFLLKSGSSQVDLWGINLYPEKKGKDWLEFDSMINLRPSLGNLSREINDPKIKEKIIKIVDKLVVR